jgi:DNA-binding CsgD family transcriptional regulator
VSSRPATRASTSRRRLVRRGLLVLVVAVANRALLLALTPLQPLSRWPADPLALAGLLLPLAACTYGLVAGSRWLPRRAAPAPAPAPVAVAIEAAPAPPEVKIPPAGLPVELTRRELDVLRLVAAGRSNAEIAGELFVSEATVKSHLGRLFGKLGCANRVQATLWAIEHGLAERSR